MTCPSMSLERLREFLLIPAVAMLSTQCQAQQSGPNAGQCQQVRAVIAKYGLQAARKHAQENYGLKPADVHRIEQECGVRNRGRGTAS